MGGVRTPIIGRPRPLPGDRRADPRCTLNCEEPDNALMETINVLYKTECIRTSVFHAGPYKTLADVEYATAGWVDWSNNRRLHSSLAMIPPIEYEQAHYAALNPEPEPV
jgi:putative transposase